MKKRRTQADLDQQYPKHERVYKHLKRYANPRRDFIWLQEGERLYGLIDSAPLDFRGDDNSADRCQFWRGTQRKWGQDTLSIRHYVYPVVLYFWEMKYGNHTKSHIPGIPTGQKLVVRPVCCHYQKVGICVNPYHYKIQTAGMKTKVPESIRDDIKSLWTTRQLTVLEMVDGFSLSEQQIRRILKGVKQNAN